MASMEKIVSLSIGVFIIYLAAHFQPGSGQVMTLPTDVNCTVFNSSAPCFTGDRNIFCLTNGTTVRGICEASIAVCIEGAVLSESMDPCTTVTTPDTNAACHNTKPFATNVIFLVTSSIFALIAWTAESGLC